MEVIKNKLIIVALGIDFKCGFILMAKVVCYYHFS